MSVARVTEITSTSKKSFKDAMEEGVERASKTLDNITGAWIANQELEVSDGKIKAFRVRMKITFVLND